MYPYTAAIVGSPPTSTKDPAGNNEQDNVCMMAPAGTFIDGRCTMTDPESTLLLSEYDANSSEALLPCQAVQAASPTSPPPETPPTLDSDSSSSSSSSSATDNSDCPSPLSLVAPPRDTFQLNILNLPYRAYLHKQPHTSYNRIQSCGPCIACDAPSARYQCSRCSLRLCWNCKDQIGRLGGDVKRLISVVARWKLGYSQGFLRNEGPLVVSKATGLKNWSERYGPHVLRTELVYEDEEPAEDEEDDGSSTDDDDAAMGELILEWNSGTQWEGLMDVLSDESDEEMEDVVGMTIGKKRDHDEFSEVDVMESEGMEGLE